MAGTPTGLVLALLGEFAGDMQGSRSINQLALSSGKAYANVHATATALISEGILIKETVGRSHLCRLNLSNDKTLLYLSLLQTVKRDDLLRADPSARQLLGIIDEHGPAMGVLLAWHCADHLLLITTAPTDKTLNHPVPQVIIPLNEFLKDSVLRATIGQHTLLTGHALYASIIAERDRRTEVLR